MAPNNKKKLLIQDELMTANIPDPVPNASNPVDWNDIRMLLLKQPDIFLVHLVIVCKAFGGSDWFVIQGNKAERGGDERSEERRVGKECRL